VIHFFVQGIKPLCHSYGELPKIKISYTVDVPDKDLEAEEFPIHPAAI
jgi:hypothetical protein